MHGPGHLGVEGSRAYMRVKGVRGWARVFCCPRESRRGKAPATPTNITTTQHKRAYTPYPLYTIFRKLIQDGICCHAGRRTLHLLGEGLTRLNRPALEYPGSRLADGTAIRWPIYRIPVRKLSGSQAQPRETSCRGDVLGAFPHPSSI